METNIESSRTIANLIEYQHKNILRVNHEYQRGLRWTDMQKQMFIDSIFRGYSIPAFYFHKEQTSAAGIDNTYFNIVDGQQRINAIYDYSEDAYPLLDPSEESGFRFPNFVKDTSCPWGGKRFSELSDELRRKLTEHKVVIYEITTEDENSIRDLFIRLQGGTPLTPQDKRDSWPGNFTEFVLRTGGKSGVGKWFGLPLFKEVFRAGSESRRRQLVAQVFMLFWMVRREKKFGNIKSSNIDEFYHSQVGFDDKSKEAQRFDTICKKLYEALRDKPHWPGHYIIHLVLLCDSMLDDYAPGWEPRLADKLHEFDKRRRTAVADVKNGREGESEYRRYYTDYGQLTQTRSDDANTIRRRHAFFVKEMINLLSPNIRDPKRSFTDLERSTVFFRDGELCQKCRMEGNEHKIEWNECEVHHIEPHSAGGRTDIDNAALVHRDCHPKADYDVKRFREWWSSRPQSK